MSDQFKADAAAYRAAKAIQNGQKLWCMWSEREPMKAYQESVVGGKPAGFVVNSPQDMRKMAADLFRLADALEEQNKLWGEDAVT